MTSLNLSTNGPSIRSSYESVLHSTDGPSGSPTFARWALFSVQAPLVNAFQDSGSKESVLKVDSTGHGELDELIEDFNDGRIQFAFVRVKDPNTSLPKNILIAWCGGGVPERTKGYFTSHLTAVSKILHGYHVQITARSQDDLEIESVMKKVADASGSKYSAGSSGASGAGAPPPVAAKKPIVFTPTSTSSSSHNPLVAARNRRNEAVDEDGWGADAPPVTRTEIEKVAPAYKPVKVNLAELTKDKQQDDRIAPSSGSGYKPIGKVDIAAIRAAAKEPHDERPTIVKGAYQPVGKVDIAAIRAAAKETRDERPTTVKGSYEPIGKVDIAAIRASAKGDRADATPEPAHIKDAPPKSVPVSERAAGYSERLTSLPKPKVANKFGGAASFTGTKAPLPSGPGGLGGAVAPPKPPPIGSASRTFADQGGKTPAQIWAEKKAAKEGGVPASPPAPGNTSPLASQKSGGEWKSGYHGKSWAPVATSNFGHAGSVTEQKTGESQPPADADGASASEDAPGSVSALRDRFKSVQPMGQAAPSSPRVPQTHTGASTDSAAPSIPEAHTGASTDDESAAPPPVPMGSRPTGGFQLPGLPSRPAAPTEEEEEEQSHEREESPVRLAVPVARAREPEPEPEPEPESPPTPPPAPAAARPIPPPPAHEEEELEPEPAPAATGSLRAVIQYDYEKAEDNEIDLVEGEIVINIDQVDDDWWMGTNTRGDTGLFPSNYVELVAGNDGGQDGGHGASTSGPATAAVIPPPAPPAEPEHEETATTGPWALAQYDYEAGEDNELSFPEGARILKIEFPDDDWWFGHYGDKSGLFPSNYVELQQ